MKIIKQFSSTDIIRKISKFVNPHYLLVAVIGAVSLFLVVWVIRILNLGVLATNIIVWILLISVAIASAIVSQRYARRGESFDSDEWKANFWQGIATESIGALLTGIFIFVIVGIGTDTELKAKLIRQMGSVENGIAITAVEGLRDREWLFDGSLHGQFFGHANLSHAILTEASLVRTDYSWAIMDGVILRLADLEGAYFYNASLIGADFFAADLADAVIMGTSNLTGANLSEANLVNVDMHCAVLTDAQLQGANLTLAQLTQAHLERTIFDERTILPYGTNWSPSTDMTLFTDPAHPQFWHHPYTFTSGNCKDIE
jgi:hypothetical protein